MDNRSSYYWEEFFHPETSKRFILIIDNDNGGKSVTNDMENILMDLLHEEIEIFDIPIMYKDSMGFYDGVLPIIADIGFRFELFPIQEKDFLKAATKLMNHEQRI